MKKKSVTFFHNVISTTLLESSPQIFREVIVQKLMPVTMEHIRDPRKSRHPIIEQKRARKEFDVHGLRISKEDQAFCSYLLRPTHTKKHPLIATLVKSLFLPHRRKKDYEKEREVTNQCLDSGTICSGSGSDLKKVPDPNRIIFSTIWYFK
jgi:hypothetical protein